MSLLHIKLNFLHVTLMSTYQMEVFDLSAWSRKEISVTIWSFPLLQTIMNILSVPTPLISTTISFLTSNAKIINLILHSISNTTVLRQNTSIQKNLYLTSKGLLSVTTPESWPIYFQSSLDRWKHFQSFQIRSTKNLGFL